MNYYELTAEAAKSIKEAINKVDLLVEEGVFSPDTSSASAELKSALETLEYVKGTLEDWDEDYANLTSKEREAFDLFVQGGA